MRSVLAALLLCLAVSGCSGSATEPASGSSAAATSTSADATPTAAESPQAATAAPTESTVTAPPVDCVTAKCIALTFDDGPWPGTTPLLLDTLEREKVPATMFLVGKQAQAHPDLVQREQALGLEIANHSMTHPTLSKLSADDQRAELSQTQDILTQLTGTPPTLMRPPYAARNKTTDQISGELGLAVVVWDSSPVDWENKDAATITRLTVSGAQPGAIVLMHDTHTWTVDAVPEIITQLRGQGYTFVTVSQLLGQATPGEVYPR